jgi:CheY-like chemotaxis protein
MDVQMPEMDGIEATRQIRAGVGAVHQPWIVALTADAGAGTRQRCLDAGMNDYYPGKPVRFESMRGLLDTMARARRRSEALTEPAASP